MDHRKSIPRSSCKKTSCSQTYAQKTVFGTMQDISSQTQRFQLLFPVNFKIIMRAIYRAYSRRSPTSISLG